MKPASFHIPPHSAVPPVLVAQLVMIASVAVFLATFTAVLAGRTHGLDEWTLRALRDPVDAWRAVGPPWLGAVVLAITTLGNGLTLTAIVLLGAAWFHFRGDRHALRMLLIVGMGGFLLMLALKFSVVRPRPTLVPWLVDADIWSFPSGHAMMTMAIFLSLAVLVGRARSSRRVRSVLVVVALGLSLTVGSTRLYLGVHYPSDLVAGWSVGLAWAVLCWLLDTRLGRAVRPGRRGGPDGSAGDDDGRVGDAGGGLGDKQVHAGR
jgi:undecaprenyl-diphosphatase